MITNDDSNHDASDTSYDMRREDNASESLIEHTVYHLRPTELRWVVQVTQNKTKSETATCKVEW